MTNEAKLIVKTGLSVPMTVDNAIGILKGTLLKLTDLNTASKSDAEGDLVGGIAASEKIAADGKVRLGVYREGRFRVIASGSIAVGDPVAIDGDGGLNYTYAIPNIGALSGSRILGIALETATDEQTYLMELKPQNAVGQGVS